jgi:hypothetical protein
MTFTTRRVSHRVRRCAPFALGLALAMLVILALPGPARAGVEEWTSAGPEGGIPLTLAIDPRMPEVIYAGTLAGGAFKSTTAATFWTPVNTGLPTSSIRAIFVDPQTSTILYLANAGAGVFKSTDGGASWGPANSGLPFPSSGELANALVADPQTSTSVYLGTISAQLTAGRIFKTSDGGLSWSERLSTDAIITSLAIDRHTPAIVYASTYGNGVFKSVNAGGTWTQINSGLADFGVFTYVVAVDPVTPTTLYAGSGGGVFKSTDGGTSWSASSTGITFPTVDAIAIDPRTPTTVYAGTYTGTAGVFKSTNGGASWSPINNGLTKLSILSLSINPLVPAILYAGTEGGGVFKTVDAGVTWAPHNAAFTGADVRGLAVSSAGSGAGADAAGGVVYAGTAGGMFKSDSGGARWVISNSGITDTFINAVSVDPASPSTVYAGTSQSSVSFMLAGLHIGTGGVFKSTDGGTTWAEKRRANAPVTSVAIDPKTPGTVYAGAGFEGVLQSTDGGASWRPTNAGLPFPGEADFVLALAIDPQSPLTLYAGTGTATMGTFTPPAGQVFKSTNGGQSWGESLATSAAVKALAVDPANPTTLYAGTFGRGVFKSLDRGGTWAPTNAGLTDLSVNALTINAQTPGIVYAGTNTAGVFRSTNGGATWTPNNPGLGVKLVPALALDPAGQCVHAGTAGKVFDFAELGDSTCPPPPTLDAQLSTAGQLVQGQVGTAVRTVATVENLSGRATAGATRAASVGIPGMQCGITQLTGVPVPFTFQAIDAVTQQPIVPVNTPVQIGVGSGQKFQITLMPTTNVCATEIQFGFNCTNAGPAPKVTAKNTLLLSVGSTAGCGLSASVTTSQGTFAPGQTLTAGGSVTSPGLPGVAADFYVGLVRPDGSIQFITPTGVVVGSVADLRSFRPLAVNVPLGTPFSVSESNVFTHRWTADEQRGSYVFFVLAVKSGALAGGTVAGDQVLKIATAPFDFP